MKTKFKDGYYLRLGGNPASRRMNSRDSMVIVKNGFVTDVFAYPDNKWIQYSFPLTVREYQDFWHLEFMGEL